MSKKTGKILIVQRTESQDWHPNEWEIDYGRIDQFEDTEQGLRREVAEEVGIVDLEIKNILRVWHIYRGPKSAENDLIGITYYCTTTNERVTLSDEHSDYKWVTPDEALKLVKVEGIRQDILLFKELKQSL